jgi:hypothetical protein
MMKILFYLEKCGIDVDASVFEMVLVFNSSIKVSYDPPNVPRRTPR